jgi:hypothetical protein
MFSGWCDATMSCPQVKLITIKTGIVNRWYVVLAHNECWQYQHVCRTLECALCAFDHPDIFTPQPCLSVGATGGVETALPPEEVMIVHIVDAFDLHRFAELMP